MGTARHTVPLRDAFSQRGVSVGATAADPLADLQRTEHIIVIARWFGVALGLLQVTIYSGAPYPPGLQAVGYALVAALALGNVALWAANRRTATVRSAQRLAAASLAFDVLIAMAFVGLYTFDPTSSLFTVLFIVTAAGALRFQLRGALLSWALVTVLYVLREAYGQWAYDVPFMIDSVTFRMGILLVVSLIVGMTAQQLWRRQQDLADALAELQRVDVWRSSLINVLAHDVRSPLSGVASCLLLVSRRGADMDPQQVEELLEVARRQTERTLHLADDLLDLARLEQGRLVLRPTVVPVREAIEAAIEIVPNRERIELQVDPELRASVDRARFEQIVANLAGNAMKHGLPPVTIAAVVAEGTLSLTVQDHGTGVPVEHQPGLFASFAHGPRSDSIGLGLWIVAELAAAHGGRAYYDEHAAAGATFVVHLHELPLEPDEAPPASAPTAEPVG